MLKSTNVAALYDLKAEFLTRKSQLKASQSTTGLVRNLSRPGVLFQTKKELEEKEMRKRKQTERINRCEAAVRKEEEERQRQKRVLEEKAKIYERLTSGEHLVGEDGKDVEFLVNFEMKKREMEASLWAVLAFEFSVHVQQQEEEKRRDEDDRKRSRWERERPEPDYEDEEERPPSPAHEPLVTRYDPSEEPGRIFGPSHMALPKDEEERLKKIKEVQVGCSCPVFHFVSSTFRTNPRRRSRPDRSAKSSWARRNAPSGRSSSASAPR